MASAPPKAKAAPKPLDTKAIAGGVVQPCPFALPGKPLSPEIRAQLVPCDLKSVTLALTSDKTNVSCTGSTAKASATPLKDVDPEINALLAAHSVVIVQVVPATTLSEKGPMTGPQSRSGDVTTTKGKASGKASFSATMKAQCGDHPSFRRSPARKAGDAKDGDDKSRELSVETQGWTSGNFVKALFGGKKFADFVFGQQSEATFTAKSCAYPASGDPTGSLTAYARLNLADEWVGEFNWAQGFKLEFSGSSMHGVVGRDGTRMKSKSSKVESSAKSLDSSRSVGTVSNKSGDMLYGKIETSGRAGTAEIKYDDGPFSGSIDADMKRYGSSDLPKDVADRFKEQGDKLKDLSKDGSLSVKLSRNGKSMIDSDNLSAALKTVQETLETGLDLVNRLVWLLETGAKIGIPVTLTFGLKASVTLLQAKNYLRFWPEAVPPKQAAAYHIAGYKRRFQFGVDLTVVTLSVTPSITLQAKILHELVASLTFSIEGQFTGNAKIGYTVSDGDNATDLKAIGKITATVRGVVKGEALSCYVMLDGTATTGITYHWTAEFDGDSLKNSQNRVTSDALTFQASLKYGNKVLDFLGLGSEDPQMQWPEDGPFIWIEEGKLNKTW